MLLAIGVFVGAMGALVTSQAVDLLENSDSYIIDTVDAINDTFGTSLDPQAVVDEFNDPEGRSSGSSTPSRTTSSSCRCRW